MRKRRSAKADDKMSVTIVEMTVESDDDIGGGAGGPMPGYYIKFELPGLEPGRVVLLGPFTTIEAAVDEAVACSAQADSLSTHGIRRSLH